ncbi:hypothetical protein LX32DRAFT_610940 [Colletotrichum zoysiae]|uniref:Uncharacterized protein n=1 Tax=Colletotrichum zoysiae TaxID=1216348 RepID=A0AAD9HSD5_9PEZI|nr:hypothetical protein LX32DRAFT_610940 [Colletotrichum zoysiae]
MLDVGGHQFEVFRSNTLEWPEDQTLRQAVRQFFEQQRGVLEPEGAVLGKIFTARNLWLIGGLKIHWTTNLADHLRLSDEDQTISIFHLQSFLQFNESFAEPVFPDGLIKETLRTLALLFPQNDKNSRSWVKAQIKYASLDPSLASCGVLSAQDRRFERFDFWRDRLIILKQAFDESSPRTLTQWWNDRRNSVQWYTFWVAIMVFFFTLLFGFIQSAEGALQVWLAWEGRGSK